jgi:hypothetical protein
MTGEKKYGQMGYIIDAAETVFAVWLLRNCKGFIFCVQGKLRIWFLVSVYLNLFNSFGAA